MSSGGGGGGGGSSSSDSSTSSDTSTDSGNYGGYTTGSDTNATDTASAESAQSDYSSSTPSDGGTDSYSSGTTTTEPAPAPTAPTEPAPAPTAPTETTYTDALGSVTLDGTGGVTYDAQPNYGGYTTGSTENADTYAEVAVDQAQYETPYSSSDPGYAEAIVNALTDPTKSAAANGGSLPGYTTTGLPLSVAKVLADQGFGDYAMSGSQTIAQAAAVQNLQDNVLPAVTKIIAAAVPGAAQTIAMAKTLYNLSTGQMTVGQALGDALYNTVTSGAAKSLGIPIESLRGLISGDMGMVATGAIMGPLTKEVAGALGMTAQQVGAIGNLTGLTGDIRTGIDSTVDSWFGGRAYNGLTSKDVAGTINNFLPNGGYLTGDGAQASTGAWTPIVSFDAGDYDFSNGTTFGPTAPVAPTPAPAPATPAPPAQDNTLQQLMMLGVLGQPQQAAAKPSQAPLADIKSYIDPFGTRNGSNGPVFASSGGSIEDLIHLLRR